MLFTKCGFKVALTLAIIKELLCLKVMEADNILVSCESRSVVSDSLRPHGLYSPWNSPGQNTGMGSHLPNPGIEPRSPALQADSLPVESPGKPIYTFRSKIQM